MGVGTGGDGEEALAFTFPLTESHAMNLQCLAQSYVELLRHSVSSIVANVCLMQGCAVCIGVAQAELRGGSWWLVKLMASLVVFHMKHQSCTGCASFSEGDTEGSIMTKPASLAPDLLVS